MNSYGIEQAEGFLHFFEGWVIFIACVGILFFMAISLQRLTPNPKPLSEAIDLDTDRLGEVARRIFTVRPSLALTGAALITAMVSFAWYTIPAPERVLPDRSPFMLFTREINGKYAALESLSPAVAKTLNADDYVSASYSGGGEPLVNVFVAYYDNQTQGGGIHSPEVCLPVGGWEVFSLEPYEVDMSGTAYGTFDVNRAVIQKGLSKQLVYYWFEQRGKRLTNDYVAKFSVIYDSWARGRMDGGLVRFVTPIIDDDVVTAEARLQEQMRATLTVLPRYVPL